MTDDYVKPQDFYARTIVYEFSWLERPISREFTTTIANKFTDMNIVTLLEQQKISVEDAVKSRISTGLWYAENKGVVIMPLTSMQIWQYRIPKSSLSEDNVSAIAEGIEEETGSKFLGFIPGKQPERELLSQFYFGMPNQLEIINEMIHPTTPLGQTGKMKSEWKYDLPSNANVFVHESSYDMFQGCQRSNCPFADNLDEQHKELGDKLTKITLEYLQELRTMAEMSFDMMTMTLLNSMMMAATDDISNMDYEQLEEENRFLEAALKMFDGAGDDDDSSSSS